MFVVKWCGIICRGS